MSIQTSSNRISTWTIPNHTFVKCNYDGGYDPQPSQTTGGWIIRYQYGKTRGWTSAKLNHAESALEAESKTLLAHSNTHRVEVLNQFAWKEIVKFLLTSFMA